MTPGVWLLFVVAATSMSPPLFATTLSALEDQRQAFRDVYPAAERGDWTPVAAHESLLRDYVLWPDLRAAYLRRRLGKNKNAEIFAFLEQYGRLKPARDLRYRLALQLAADNKHEEFLTLYEEFYQHIGVARLDCLALTAEIAMGSGTNVAGRAEPLWLVGKSQVDECDPVFSYLRDRGQLNTVLYRKRFALARDARQFSLALHLARSIDEDHITEANRWLKAQNNPERFVRQAIPQSNDATYTSQLVYAISKLARKDPAGARHHWLNLQESRHFERRQSIEVERDIALWAARLNLPEASTLLADLSAEATNDEVIRWQIRNHLRQENWREIALAIDALTTGERQRAQWQYWKAVALQETGHSADSMLVMATIAQQRDYYGFLAADQLGLEYSFAQESIASTDEIINRLAASKSLVRARELYQVGLDGRGRSEWDSAIKDLSAREKRQAAVLAHRWGWHSRAIATAAQSGALDDLELRYPLPHRESFELYTSDAKIRESWAYGVARSESLFMRDIRSSAGAVGVMQLMPETGRRTAIEMSYPYAGLTTLTDPASNIRIGTFYLGKLYSRFSQHSVLATAAYNAGPLRVEKWLPVTGTVDARVWIENIPFDETRKYVRRVLAADTIFRWRLTGETHRISAQLSEISARTPPQIASY